MLESGDSENIQTIPKTSTDSDPETDNEDTAENQDSSENLELGTPAESSAETEDEEHEKEEGESAYQEDSEDSHSKHPDEELEVLSDLWDAAMRVPLPPDVARHMTPFAKFRKMPAPGQKILREALDLDADFREKLLEDWQENPVKFADEQTAVMAVMWLSRPPRWREEIDRFVIMKSSIQALQSENKDLQVKLRQAEAEQQRVKNLQDKRKKKTAKAKSQSEKDQLKRVQAESQAEKLTEDFEAAKESIRSLKSDLANESNELENLQRHHNKLRKTLSKREQRISQLEREIRHLQNPEEEEEPDERRRGFTKDEIWGDALEVQEPRLPISPPPGVSQFSRTAAEHYATETSILFVDGYNFIFCGWRDETEHIHNRLANSAHKPGLEVFRNRLIDRSLALEAKFRPYNLEQICLVFDGKYPAPQADYPPQSGIQVVFSSPDKIADDEIVRRITQYPSTRQITVVSDDHDLRSRCYDKGATIMSVTQLLYLFE